MQMRDVKHVIHELASYPIRTSLIVIHFVIGFTPFFAHIPKALPGAYSVVNDLAGPFWWVTALNWSIAAGILVGLTWPDIYKVCKGSLLFSLVYFNALAVALVVAAFQTSGLLVTAALCWAFSLVNIEALHRPPPSKIERRLDRLRR